MPFTMIKGTFHVVGYSPDGDSIRFKADDPVHWARLSGPPARLNARGHAQLRIEAIDTLETHYSPPSSGSALHQPLDLAEAAADALLSFAGIRNVVWNANRTLVASASDGTRGYILARAVEKNRRPVAFVFAGDPPEADGSDAFLDPERLTASYNFHAVQAGLAYGTFYTGLFADLRATLIDATTQARAAKRGLYLADVGTTPFTVDGLSDLTDNLVVMPKLFRRLAEYIGFNGSVLGFKDKLESYAEPVLDLATSNFTHFDTFIEQEPGSLAIRMTRLPEQLVFDEMPTRPINAFSTLLEEQEDRSLL
ncbi:hypothetical protein [Ancylobacter amanitiformis]|uniref:Nuclease n=1 Tax=Ancylobacter amanitiformis TaxID=217069 RepID=A0ABU0LQB2_9HYPH|nr:hypothetical protein [Ancylobacter amanitiformis]MDQ0510778.1 hypothetical protein [Ancylobacter amanitiformis]